MKPSRFQSLDQALQGLEQALAGSGSFAEHAARTAQGLAATGARLSGLRRVGRARLDVRPPVRRLQQAQAVVRRAARRRLRGLKLGLLRLRLLLVWRQLWPILLALLVLALLGLATVWVVRNRAALLAAFRAPPPPAASATLPASAPPASPPATPAPGGIP